MTTAISQRRCVLSKCRCTASEPRLPASHDTEFMPSPLQLTQTRAEEFYGEHKGKPFFPNLVNFMTSGPIWALVLAKPGAILAWREFMGPTNTQRARAENPRW